MITLKDASFKYPNSNNVILKNLNLNIQPNNLYAITSLDGEGKSSLLKIFLGQLNLTRGSFQVNDIDFDKLSKIQHRTYFKNLYFLNVNPTAFEAESVYENLLRWLPIKSKWRTWMRWMSKQDEKLIYEILVKVKLSNVAFSVVKNLDGTNKMRLELAKMLISNCKLILADDPTSHMDSLFSDEIVQIIKQYCSDNQATLIYVSHDFALLNRNFDKIYYLGNQTVKALTQTQILQRKAIGQTVEG